MPDKLGIDAVLNVKLDGVSGVSAWAELVNIKDLEQGLTKDIIDNTTRANNGWKSKIGTLKEGDLTFTMPWSPSDPLFIGIRNAWTSGAAVGFQIFDGETNAAGLIADFGIGDFKWTQNSGGIQEASVTAFITFVDTAPAWQDPS